MRPDRRDWTTFRTTAPPDVRTPHVDFLLRFVIDRSAAAGPRVSARLDALERTLVDLTKQWRAEGPVSPARELRLNPETLRALLEWLEAPGHADKADLGRLGVYASGALTDVAVPADWLRMRFG